MPKLFIYPKNGDSFIYQLKEEKVTLGRAHDNTVAIPDPFCSSYHAAILQEKGRVYVLDDASKNGTYVNGQRIQIKAELNKGDEVLIGSTRIILDKELSTKVEMSDVSPFSENVNTIMHLDKILEKNNLHTTIKAGIPMDLERMKSEHRAFSVMSKVSGALLLHKPLNELLDYVMDLINENLPMDRGVMMLKEGNPPQMIPKVVRVNNKKLQREKIQVSQTIIDKVVNQNSSILTSDTQSDTRFKAKESIIRSNIRSAMCVPLFNNREIIGIIYADRISLARPFTEEDLKLLTLLSNLAAVKIENSKLIDDVIEKERIEKELDLAAQIQKDFLPKEKPDFPRIEIAGNNIPCYQIGGDYYDFIPIDSSRIGIIIADVSGKGVSASLLMASLRAAIHSEISEKVDIRKMVSKLNDFVHRSSAANCFISFFFAEFTVDKGELRFINAGHNPPLIFEKNGGVNRLESCGLCLGMFPSVQYDIKNISLKEGDTAVLYTDGITESRNKEGKEFGEDGLISLVKKNRKLSAQDLLSRIYEEVETFISGVDPMDDMTVVVIKKDS
ncbi:MAG: SpoIIE family protein phosphatase [Candidatus Aminicenantes bacterium]|nr:SpoIIE family protein phosphatase [Candidatus Aminicenantes bacterium]